MIFSESGAGILCDDKYTESGSLWDETQSVIEDMMSIVGRENPPALKKAEYMLMGFLDEAMDGLCEYVTEQLRGGA